MITTNETTNSGINRRQFITGAGAAAATFTMLEPGLLRGAAANSKINLGLIGCGGRGQWIANLFAKHGGYQIVAAADYFQDKVESAGKKFQIEPAKCFTGLSGYRRLLEQKVDAVVIETPPYFHPEQAAAAVEAGKHVYLAKPVAVDVPGCESIAGSGRKATVKKLSFLVDFQTRAHPFYQEAVRRVQAGMIGKIITVDTSYHANTISNTKGAGLPKDANEAEQRLRSWVLDRVLSGDIITEQNIHALDVVTWFLDASPIKAYGTGGRARPFGTCWDHFAVIYYFPNDVIASFNSKQVGFAYNDILCRVFGEIGTADTHYSGEVWVKSKDDGYNPGKIPSMYSDGAERNIATFHDMVTKGDCTNPTVTPSVRSNLTTILGRTAAYRRTEVTWDEIMKADERLQADLQGLKA